MTNDYNQLCGALGVLKSHNAALDWLAINEQLRGLGRRLGVAVNGDPTTKTTANIYDPVHAEISVMHRHYRDMCLDAGLIRRGELFDIRDCVPIV